MLGLLQAWEQTSDRRAVFLSCYAMMTANMLAAIEAGEFNDPPWVKQLLEHFADFYFHAVEAYTLDKTKTPVAWDIAFETIDRPHIMALQHLLLGVNAHINNDLIYALGDMLEPDWAGLDAEQRGLRHADHNKVNQVITETIDAVQDQILDRYSPMMEVVDEVFGRLDEWVAAKMIAGWRDDVWEKAVRWVEDPAEDERQAMRKDIEERSLHFARLFLLDDLGKAP